MVIIGRMDEARYKGHDELLDCWPAVVAAVPAQPVGWNKAHPLYMRELSMKSWAPELMKRDPSITPDMIEKFLVRMFPNPDWLFTVDRDPRLLARYMEIPRGFVATWEESIGPYLIGN